MAPSKNLLPNGKKIGRSAPRGRPRGFDLERALDQSMMLFWQNGFRETSLDEVARAVGVKKPSLYAAFGDKETLFRKVIERYCAKFSQPEMRALEDHDDIRVALSAFFHRGIANACGRGLPHGCLLATAFADSALLPARLASEIKALVRRADQVMARRLEQAVQCGQLPPDFDVQNTARFLNSVMHGLALRARAGESVRNLRSVQRVTLRCVG